MIDEEVLKLLRCPEDKTPFHAADDVLIEKLNRAIADGAVEIRNRGGQVLTEPVPGGLVRQDNKYLYPILDEIHLLLVDEAISLEQIS